MNLSEKAMNASEKRILKLAIILFTIGLTVRYLPWGLPSIETFEVGDAIIVANAPPGAFSDAPLVIDTNKIMPTKLAEKIIEQRTASGPFKGPADLKKVHGIGKKKLENMLQSIIFD